MARICPITKKGSRIARGFSNRTRATKYNPTGKERKHANLQKKRFFIPELKKFITMTVSTTGIKTINKNGIYATLKKVGLV